MASREELLKELREMKIDVVTCSYAGYGDSGQIEEIEFQPKAELDNDLRNKLEDFFWDLLWAHHAGFENNDGGQGDFTWAVGTDSICLVHADNVVVTEETTHEI